MGFSELSNDTVAGRVARYPLRILPHNLAVPILRGKLKGIKWLIGSQRHACWLGIYERALQTVVAREVKPGGVFYDVGANVGFYSLLASVLIGSGKVFAFEPLPKNICYLKRHLELNRTENVEVFEVAISDQIGALPFLAEETRAMGRLERGGNCFVQSATLDALLQEGRIAPPDYIKMDIEGAELLALRGASHIFREFHPILFLATHGRDVHADCCRVLESWGYECRPLGEPASEDRAEVIAKFRK
jgi:FkbM family methyltransferase